MFPETSVGSRNSGHLVGIDVPMKRVLVRGAQWWRVNQCVPEEDVVSHDRTGVA